jgi:enoyl-[acyl-carrier-protein] reductase (NADH)
LEYNYIKYHRHILNKISSVSVDQNLDVSFKNADELSGTLIWLLSDASKFINGIIVTVDGGFSAFSGV